MIFVAQIFSLIYSPPIPFPQNSPLFLLCRTSPISPFSLRWAPYYFQEEAFIVARSGSITYSHSTYAGRNFRDFIQGNNLSGVTVREKSDHLKNDREGIFPLPSQALSLNISIGGINTLSLLALPFPFPTPISSLSHPTLPLPQALIGSLHRTMCFSLFWHSFLYKLPSHPAQQANSLYGQWRGLEKSHMNPKTSLCGWLLRDAAGSV